MAERLLPESGGRGRDVGTEGTPVCGYYGSSGGGEVRAENIPVYESSGGGNERLAESLTRITHAAQSDGCCFCRRSSRVKGRQSFFRMLRP